MNKWGLLPTTTDLDELERQGLASLADQASDIRPSRTTLGGLDAIRADYRGHHPMTQEAELSFRTYSTMVPPVACVFCTDDLGRDDPIFDAVAATVEFT